MNKKLDIEKEKDNYFLNKLIENENRISNLEIELKSFLKNINYLKLFSFIILGLLGFFGYREITSIRKNVFTSIKPQVEYVDSLIASIKTSRLDSLSELIEKRTREQEDIIKDLENLIFSTKELERLFIKMMPENIPCNVRKTVQKGRTIKGVHDYFDIIVPKNGKISASNKNIDMVLKLKISHSLIHHISIFVFKGNTITAELNYLPKESYNKFSFQHNLTGKTHIDVGIFLKNEWEEKYPPFYYRRINITK